MAAELDGLDDAGIVSPRPYVDSLARLNSAGEGFAATATVEVRLSSATVTVRIDTSGTVDVEAERKRIARTWPPPRRNWRRPRPNSATTSSCRRLRRQCERRSPNATRWPPTRLPGSRQSWKGSAGERSAGSGRTGGRRDRPGAPGVRGRCRGRRTWVDCAARGPVHPLDDEGPADPSAFTTDISADLAELAEVEAELDTRWPETKIEPSLTRISTLMDLLGSPQLTYPSIHIAGTNGKTSVTRMIDALLVALHRRTGRITSPHLQLVTERISIDGTPIAPRTYIDTYRELEPYITMVDDSSTAAGGPRMSKFEVLTAMAYAAFAEAPVDVAVVETGMGGRWDATNVIDSQVRVITPIALDHADYLGDTLAAIAGEGRDHHAAQG